MQTKPPKSSNKERTAFRRERIGNQLIDEADRFSLPPGHKDTQTHTRRHRHRYRHRHTHTLRLLNQEELRRRKKAAVEGPTVTSGAAP